MTETHVEQTEDRFAISVDASAAGFAAYLDHGGQRIFFHTEIDQAFRGLGLSAVLIGQALRATRASGQRIVGVCPAVAAYLTKHPEYDDASDPVTPEINDWLRQALGTTPFD